MKKIWLILLLMSPTLWAVTQKIEVNGMVCAFCAQGIEKSLNNINTTKDVYVNLDAGFVILESQSEELAEEKIKKIIVDAGYDVTQISLIDDTAENIRKRYEKK
jgi:copper chaperone CopZ